MGSCLLRSWHLGWAVLMIAADIHNGHVYHHQLQSRRVKLTTGNAISMRLCLLLLFVQVKNTQKLKRYEPKCPTKNQSTLPFSALRNAAASKSVFNQLSAYQP